MRRLKLLSVIGVFAIGLFFVSNAGALTSSESPAASPNHPSSGDLVTDPEKWDGRQIQFTGEAITEAMERGDRAWIHLNDDAYYERNVEEGAPLGGYNSGHAVWLPVELTKKITYYGDYTHEGDIVRVSGVFNDACAVHGGDMDIHAEDLDVLRKGHVVREQVHPLKWIMAAVLALLSTALWQANRRLTHRERRGIFGFR